MDRPLISLIHGTRRIGPSEGFPRGWRDAHDAFWLACDEPKNVEYIVVVHESRWNDVAGEMPDGSLDWGHFRLVKNAGRDCIVDQLNAGAKAATGELLSCVMDDLRPPEHWDSLLFDAVPLGRYHAEKERVIVCSSGATPERDRELMICGAVSRSRIERIGFLLDPDFESMFADNWFAACARKDEAAGLCKIIDRLDIKFDHQHPIFEGRPLESLDEAYQQQNRQEAYRSGAVIFHQKMTGSRVMMMGFPGEQFRSELVGSRFQLMEDTKLRSRYGMVAPHWCFTSNVYMTRIELTKGMLEFPSCTKDEDLVLMADDDNPIDYAQLEMLIRDLDEYPELGGVVAWCWCDHDETKDSEAKNWVMSCGRQNMADLACLRFTPQDFDAAIERGSFLISSADVAPHAFWSGLPVLLIRRSVLERMGWRAFVARTADPVLVDALKAAREFLRPFNETPGFEFHCAAFEAKEKIDAALEWASIIDNTRNGMTSEDTSFFLRAHELGIQFAVDIRVRVPHMKWRGITPQYVPQSEKAAVMASRGDVMFAWGDEDSTAGVKG